MTSNSSHDCRVLVVQNGARHDYAVPLALAKHGMLAGFFTDACGNQGLGRMASLVPSGAGHGAVALLKNRKVPEAVRPLTRSFPLAVMAQQWMQKVVTDSDLKVLGRAMVGAGLQDATLVYSSLGWSPWFLKFARRRGLRVVMEFYVRPSLWRVHLEEYRLFPDWQSESPYEPPFHQTEQERLGPCSYSDDILAPTQAVKDDIVREGLFPPECIHIVPYGIGEVFFGIENSPRPGNVLYVGSCTLIKGIHYLAMAAERVIREAGPGTPVFTAAGDVTEVVRSQPLCRSIQFLGRVPRSAVSKLYLEADVLVFPTLSDSFGAVILEAMAAGIPVICSPYCADIVEDGVSGFVVEPRDTTALAEAILKLTQDRALRDRMARAARSRARDYSRECCGKLLVDTLRCIQKTHMR